jgi:eukaryotic-like serine/threonine-protein kinase
MLWWVTLAREEGFAMTLPDRQRWAQLSPLLEDLLELDGPGRRARLAELRAIDRTMADELESMVSANDRAEGCHFLTGDAQGESAAPATLVGERIGAYLIEASLGQGGTGSVWRARRVDGRFEGAVAIKLLHLSLIGRAGALRFEREGAILARLTHPNIARLLDAGVTPSGQPYLVLDLVQGERIDHHCDTLRLDVEQRLALFDAVLAAVAHAHSHLVIHRDIKPTNILVSADGHVKLLDFGIAKLLEDGVQGAPVTAEGQRALTPEYAAPEQLQGAPVTTATDVYALGVLLYQLLTGRHPTAPDHPGSTEMMRATLDTDPLRMSTALTLPGPAIEAPPQVAAARNTSLPRLRRLLHGDLENIVARTLRKNPLERYQTVAALAEDLRRYRAHEPVSARADSLAYRCARFMRRRRGTVAAALLVMLAVTAGLVGTVTQARLAQSQALQARHERDNALRQLAYASSAYQFISFLLEEGSDTPFTTTELLARGEALAEKQFSADPAQQANLDLMLGSLHFAAHQWSKGTALLVRAQNAARDASDPSLQAEIECELAAQRGGTGSFDQALTKIDAAIETLHAAPELDRDTAAKCLFGRSQVNRLRGDAKAELTDAQAALDALGTPRSYQRLLAIDIRAALAGAQLSLGQEANAISAYNQAIAELEAMGRGNTRLMAVMHVSLGATLASSGQTLRALETYEQALHLFRGFGDTGANPTLAGNYARLLIELGRPRDAMPLIEHALDEASTGGNKLVASIVSLQGAPAWCAVQDFAHCAELLAAAESGFTALLPAGHSRFGNLKTVQAQLALARADLPQARTWLKQAVAIFDAATNRSAIGIRALTLLACTEQQLGELDAAEMDAARAVAQARDAMAGFEHSQWLGSALVAQGMVQRSRGESAAAQATWRAALAELQATVGDSAPATAEVRKLLADA